MLVSKTFKKRHERFDISFRWFNYLRRKYGQNEEASFHSGLSQDEAHLFAMQEKLVDLVRKEQITRLAGIKPDFFEFDCGPSWELWSGTFAVDVGLDYPKEAGIVIAKFDNDVDAVYFKLTMV